MNEFHALFPSHSFKTRSRTCRFLYFQNPLLEYSGYLSKSKTQTHYNSAAPLGARRAGNHSLYGSPPSNLGLTSLPSYTLTSAFPATLHPAFPILTIFFPRLLINHTAPFMTGYIHHSCWKSIYFYGTDTKRKYATLDSPRKKGTLMINSPEIRKLGVYNSRTDPLPRPVR